MMILIAGPYRSGTGDDADKIAANLKKLEDAALSLWGMGHLPVVAEWISLPLIKKMGSKETGDSVWQDFAYPVADRLLSHCNAVLRLPGESKGADGDVAQAKLLGLDIYTDISQIELGSPVKGRAV